jgi:hypothetical protein
MVARFELDPDHAESLLAVLLYNEHRRAAPHAFLCHHTAQPLCATAYAATRTFGSERGSQLAVAVYSALMTKNRPVLVGSERHQPEPKTIV